MRKTKKEAGMPATSPAVEKPPARRVKKTAIDLDKMLGARLKMMRMHVDMSQTELAVVAGMTYQQVQKYENGSNRMAVSTLLLFIDALGCSLLEVIPPAFHAKLRLPEPKVEYVEKPVSKKAVAGTSRRKKA